MPKTPGTWDYVIVGAGTAGCLLANRLSADPEMRVLLLEAGGEDDWIWIHIPVGYLYCIGNPRTDWCYRTEPEPGLNGRSILYARGKVLGGCSSINAMVYMRGQARDYDEWRSLGNPGWGWDDVLPVFKRTEDHHLGADAMHGSGGEWRVERQRLSWEILDAFRDAMAEAGIPKIPDFYRGNEESFAEARIETILAAGAIGSPQILQLSGIGPGALLSRHGIAVTHESPGVGENLQDHLQLRMGFKVENVRTLNERANTLTGKISMGLEYLFFRTGPLAMAPSQLGGFTKSDPAQKTANLEYHIQPLSLDRLGEPLHRFPAFTASVANLRPASRGSVKIKSSDPRAAPAIRPNYLSTDADRKIAAEALRLTRRIAQQPALAQYQPSEFLPGASFRSDEELARAAGDIGTTIFHPVGTCRMGPDSDPRAVVDARLRVRGVWGLRVVDASIMPTITSGNTNSPTLMIAERGSDMIREDRKRLPQERE